jgi:hypothetical protein
LTFACSGAEKITPSDPTTDNNYPSWYGGFEFTSDSTQFMARATAVADNAVTAQARAEKEARGLLESYLAKELEDIRAELERDGSEIVQQPDFILTLRNAHYKIEEIAAVSNSKSIEIDSIFRGFVKVEISKSTLEDLIQNAFDSNKSFQDEFVGSIGFKEFVGS